MIADPDPAAVRGRVRALLERFDRIDLQIVVVAPPDETRREARHRARSAAIVAGRGPVLDEAVAAVQETTLRAFARGGFNGTWALTKASASVATADDRVAASAALEEAMIATVVEDLVDPETLDILRSTAAGLVDMTGLIAPGSVAAIAAPGTLPDWLPIQVLVVVIAVAIAVILFLSGPIGFSVTFALAIAIAVGLRRRRRPTGD